MNMAAVDERTDALAYLPRKSATIDFRKGQVLWLAAGLHLVMHGMMQVWVGELLENIYGEMHLFEARPGMRAVGLEAGGALMSWTNEEVESAIARDPALGVALFRAFRRRDEARVDRLHSFATEKCPERIMRSIIYFGERLGTTEPDGSLKAVWLAHQILSGYVGTSREVVTATLGKLRREGYIRQAPNSRNGMLVYADPLRERLSGDAA